MQYCVSSVANSHLITDFISVSLDLDEESESAK